MIFDSLTFVLFFAIVIGLYFVVSRSWTGRKSVLLVASYVFYMAWNPLFSLLLVFSTVVDWFTANAMVKAPTPTRRKHLLWLSLASNLGLLAFFKYSLFLASSAVGTLNVLGMDLSQPTFSIVLPVGISFYTFQTLSYTIDVYRGRLEPAKTFLDFALFVSFFPQLVAGPIVRASDFIPQMDDPKPFDPAGFGWGVSLMVLGLFQKMFLADTLAAPVADIVYNGSGALSFVDAWVGTAAFAAQIFCDFSGYSTCAIGAALCLGFKLPDNFQSPYAARGFSDFWRRWHISLSTWLRDYLYISLGGNRKGPVRMYIALFLTMLIGGLWHGASWVYVVWGALHGTFLVLERLMKPWLTRPVFQTRPARALGWAATIFVGMYAWVFFRSATFTRAGELLYAMSVPKTLSLDIISAGNAASALVCWGGLVAAHLMMRDRPLRWWAQRSPWWLTAILLAACLVLIAMSGSSDRAFIYFQF